MNQTKILIVVGIIVILAISIYVAKKSGVSTTYQPVSNKTSSANDTIDSPIDFGYKMIWIAVNTDNKKRIAELLSLDNPQPANWESGIDIAYGGGIFISPKIGDWTLVAGTHLANTDNLEGITQLESTLNKLSSEFGEAQSFATHRVVEYHHWIKSVNGKTIRTYAYLGESGENIKIDGEPTNAEIHLNLFNSFSPEAEDEAYWEREDVNFADEELVMQIAENWSVNPTKLSERNDIAAELGMVSK
jgi:hypothetical protein